MATDRIADRKLRQKQARRAQIIGAARKIAEREGWSSVTVRRLSEEIAYSQPVLYSHFESREAILAAVAIEGFQELGRTLEEARTTAKPATALASVAAAYLRFAESSPAMYAVMFSVALSIPFGDAATPPELRYGFSQLRELFEGKMAKPDVAAELFWSSLHGVSELTRTGRLPPIGQKERLRSLVKLFSSFA